MTDKYGKYGLYALDVLYLREALADVLKGGNKVAEVFYDELFSRFPRVKGLFSSDKTKHERMFRTLIEAATAEMLNPESLEPLLASVGRHHREHGVSVSHFEMGREPFLIAIRSCLDGDEFDQHREAWDNLYSLLCDVMRSGILRR